MAEILHISVPGIPATKGSWKSIRVNGKPRLIPDNPDEEGWALAVAWAARAKLRGAPPTSKRCAVRCEFTMPPRAGRKSYNRDADKLVRSVLDAMTKIVYIDDEQVDEIWASKRRGDTPGATIIVETIE